MLVVQSYCYWGWPCTIIYSQLQCIKIFFQGWPTLTHVFCTIEYMKYEGLHHQMKGRQEINCYVPLNQSHESKDQVLVFIEDRTLQNVQSNAHWTWWYGFPLPTSYVWNLACFMNIVQHFDTFALKFIFCCNAFCTVHDVSQHISWTVKLRGSLGNDKQQRKL